MEQKKFVPIDIGYMIKKRLTFLYYLLYPLLPLIRWYVKEKQLNDLLSSLHSYSGIEFIRKCLIYLEIKYNFVETEKLSLNNKYIFVANHPLGGPDGLIFASVVDSIFPGTVKFMVNDALFEAPYFDDLFIPINKSKVKESNINLINDTFAGKNNILYFPAGVVSRGSFKKTEDLSWKSTFVKKALKYKKDVVPVYIDARNSKRFYFKIRILDFLSVPNFVIVIMLIREAFKQKGKTINVTIGGVIPYNRFSEKLDTDSNSATKYSDWADLIKTFVYTYRNRKK